MVAPRSKWQKGENKAADLNKKLQQRKEGDTTKMTKSRYYVCCFIAKVVSIVTSQPRLKRVFPGVLFSIRKKAIKVVVSAQKQ